MLERNRADGFTDRYLSIGCLQQRRVVNRQLLLARPEFWIVLSRLQMLRIERLEHRTNHARLAVHAVGAKAQAVIGGDECAVIQLTGEIELVFERGAEAQAL